MAASTRQEDCAAICTYLLSQHPSIRPHVRDRWSRTALMMAARQGHVSVVQQLVAADPSQHHVNATTTTTRQDSAVVMATRWGRWDVLEFLLEETGGVDWRDTTTNQVPRCLLTEDSAQR